MESRDTILYKRGLECKRLDFTKAQAAQVLFDSAEDGDFLPVHKSTNYTPADGFWEGYWIGTKEQDAKQA